MVVTPTQDDGRFIPPLAFDLLLDEVVLRNKPPQLRLDDIEYRVQSLKIQRVDGILA